MGNVSILFVTLHCILYLQSTITYVDSRPPENVQIENYDEATEASRVATTNQRNLQRQAVPILKKKFSRLPGLCRRLKRRRITLLCNTSQFCSAMKSRHGQICSCPKGSKCSHFFLWSL